MLPPQHATKAAALRPCRGRTALLVVSTASSLAHGAGSLPSAPGTWGCDARLLGAVRHHVECRARRHACARRPPALRRALRNLGQQQRHQLELVLAGAAAGLNPKRDSAARVTRWKHEPDVVILTGDMVSGFFWDKTDGWYEK